jgi:hypothetical protein
VQRFGDFWDFKGRALFVSGSLILVALLLCLFGSLFWGLAWLFDSLPHGLRPRW